MAKLNSGTRIYGNTTIDTFLTVSGAVASNSNTTGTIIVTGGIGVSGNVYANAVYDGGIEVIAFANQAFTQANSANVLAQAAFDKANTDATNISATAGVYGNASHVPVTTLTANGRVSLITNTAIAIDTAALTSGTLADARLPATGTAGTYANASHVPVITTDAKGRVTAVTNTAIAIDTAAITSGTLTIARGGTNQTTFTTGQRILFDGTSLASQANVTTTVTGGLAAANTITALTTNAYGDITAYTGAAIAIDTAQITSGTLAVARGGTGNTSLDVGSILIGSGTNAITTLANTGTAGTYGNSTHIPVVTTDAYGRVSAVTNTVIQSSTTSVKGIVQLTDSISSTSTTTAATPNSVKDAYDLANYADQNALDAIFLAQNAYDSSNTKFSSSGGTISGDVSVTGNLTVTGTQTIVNTSTVSTNDSLIKLAANNVVGDVLDIGFYGQSNTGTSIAYHGLIKQAAGNFVLFKDFSQDPSGNVINTAYVTVANTATLRANLTGGTVSSLASAIGVADGGTGVTTSTGSGSVTLNTNPILTTPNIGVPSFATLTNATGLPVSGIVASTSTALGVGSVELGHATDTTLSRSSAGVLAVEGVVVPTISSASTLTNKTITFPIIDNIKMGFSTTATAAGTTTLTSASNYYQRFTGTTTQTVVLPVTSTLVAGVAYEIENASTGNLTVNSSGGNLVVTIIPGVTVQCRCIGTALTTAADWDPEYNEFAAITGTGSVVLNTSPTFAGTITTGTGVGGIIAGANVIYSNVFVANSGGYIQFSDGSRQYVANAGSSVAASSITGVINLTQGGSNNTTYTTGAILTSNGTAFVALANTGIAGTYGNSTHIPVVTTDAYGRVSGVTNTAISGGGGVTGFTSAENTTAPNATVYVDSLTASAASANADVAFVAKGTGATTAQVADSTATGGNKRGQYATDWQKSRSAAEQVASGLYSFIGGGDQNKASGNWSVVSGGYINTVSNSTSGILAGQSNIVSGGSSIVGGGDTNTASGSYAAIVGGANNLADASYSFVSGGSLGTTRGIIGYHVFPACFGVVGFGAGNSQSGLLLVGTVTTNATAAVLTSDGSAASTNNQVILPNNSAYYFKGSITAGVTGAGNSAAWTFEGLIKRGANAAATSIVQSVVNLIAQDSGASTWVVAIAADTTNGGLKVTVTGQASTTIRWVCKIETTEMTY